MSCPLAMEGRGRHGIGDTLLPTLDSASRSLTSRKLKTCRRSSFGNVSIGASEDRDMVMEEDHDAPGMQLRTC